MKKIISFVMIIVSAFFMCSVSSHAMAYIEVKDPIVDERVIEVATGLFDSGKDDKATGLILSKSLSLAKTDTQLIITAKTIGASEVTKCGFTYIKLQRLLNGSWTDYSAYCYFDQYNNSTSKTFSKYLSTPKGYTYRVICEHYAEKPFLGFWTTSETSYNETTSLYF